LNFARIQQKKNRYHQPQGHFRYFTTQLRESTQNNQNYQTPSLSSQPILQTTGLSQNPDSQKSEVQKNGNKQGLDGLSFKHADTSNLLFSHNL